MTGLTNGVSYRFRVRALAGSEEGPHGKSVGGPPNGLRAQALDGSVELVWADPSDSRIAGWQYRVREGQGRWSGWQPVPGSTASTTSYTVPDLTNGVSYRFRVRGVASNGGVVLAWPMVETSPDGSLAVRPPEIHVGMIWKPRFKPTWKKATSSALGGPTLTGRPGLQRHRLVVLVRRQG